jgi:sugar phosphate isomerase/epimerase
MADLLDPSVFFQIDTYWVQVGGVNVVDVLKQLKARTPVIHVKDGPADDFDADMMAVGEGVMDWNTILANTSAEWYIVELDRCATNMMTAVKDSYAYLVGEGFARGNK